MAVVPGPERQVSDRSRGQDPVQISIWTRNLEGPFRSVDRSLDLVVSGGGYGSPRGVFIVLVYLSSVAIKNHFVVVVQSRAIGRDPIHRPALGAGFPLLQV